MTTLTIFLCSIAIVGTLFILEAGRKAFNAKSTAVSWVLVFLLALTPLSLTGCLELEDEQPQGPPDGSQGLLTVHYIDVDQADAILLQFPSGQTMLIDGGTYKEGDTVLDYLAGQNITKLDYVIGTHPHSDHIGGLIKVIKQMPVGKIYMPQVVHNTKTYRDLLTVIKDNNLKVTAAQAGQTLDVGPQVQAQILSPGQQEYTQINDYSVVLKITHDQVKFLFTGDAEAVAEQEMLEAGYDLRADVLKVGHHGSTTSTTDDFLAAVAPADAVICVGSGNDYGHPHREILARLQQYGVQIWRTDQHGTVVAYSNGGTVSFNEQPPWAGSEVSGNPQQWDQDTDHDYPVEITHIDLVDEVATITNKGNHAVDLARWQLVSVKGDQRFDFAPGTVLPAAGVLKIVSGANAQPAPDTIIWTKEYIWHNDGDPGELYDPGGRLVDVYPR